MRSTWWADLLPAALDAIVEAAWIAALYLLVEIAWGRDELLLGVPQLALLAAAGIGVGVGLASWRKRRTPTSRGAATAQFAFTHLPERVERLIAPVHVDGPSHRHIALAASATCLAAIAGWLLAPDVRAALAALDLARALNLHPGGWLAGLAFLRGLGHGRGHEDVHEPGRAMRVGLPALVAVWLIGRGIGGNDHLLFEEGAVRDTLVFMAAGLVGLGVAGIRALAAAPSTTPSPLRDGGEQDVAWYRNRQSILLLVTVVAAMVAIAVPSVSVAGRGLIDTLLALLWVCAEIAALVVVVRAIPRAVSIAVPFLLLSIVIVAALRFIGFRPEAVVDVLDQVRQALSFAAARPSDSGPGDAVTLLGVVLAAGAIVVVVVLVAVWLRRRSPPAAGKVFEERSIVLEPSELTVRWPSVRRTRRSSDVPTDAVTAYRALLRRLEPDAELRRAPGETPADHARRMREWSPGGRAVGRLALDYELVQFAGRALTAREEARALARWRRLETIIRRRPKPQRAADPDELAAWAERRRGRAGLEEEVRPPGS